MLLRLCNASTIGVSKVFIQTQFKFEKENTYIWICSISPVNYTKTLCRLQNPNILSNVNDFMDIFDEYRISILQYDTTFPTRNMNTPEVIGVTCQNSATEVNLIIFNL